MAEKHTRTLGLMKPLSLHNLMMELPFKVDAPIPVTAALDFP